MFIETEGTPNPATLKFLPGQEVMGLSPADFASARSAERSPLASALFGLPGVARVRGIEFSARHSLAPLGAWGKGILVFANHTRLELSGSQQAAFNAFIPSSASWGASFSRGRLSAIAKWNYRGLQRGGPVAGVDGFQYSQARTTVDLSAERQVWRGIGVFVSAQNVFNVPEVLLRYGPQTPGYARRYQTTTYGTQLSLGIKGTF